MLFRSMKRSFEGRIELVMRIVRYELDCLTKSCWCLTCADVCILASNSDSVSQGEGVYTADPGETARTEVELPLIFMLWIYEIGNKNV